MDESNSCDTYFFPKERPPFCCASYSSSHILSFTLLYICLIVVSLWMQVSKDYSGYIGNFIIHDPDWLAIRLGVGLFAS